VLAAAVLAVLAYGSWRGLDEELGRSLAAQIASVGIALVVGTIAYGLSCRVLGVRELQALRSLRRQRGVP
jgi:hypothetical protein